MFHIAHCCHFTPNTLAFAAQQAGLKILAADTGKHEAEPWAMTFLLTKSSPEEKRSAYSADEEIEAISKHLELLVEAEGDAWPSSKDFNKCQIGKIDQEFIVKYCRLRFEKILADIPLGEKLVCWGTGTHSVFLLKALSEDILKRINFFIDEIEIPSYFFNWKVFHPDKVDWSKVATVVISTDANENELSKRAEKMLPSNVKIEKLYEPLGADKIISAKWK
jgi:hypothetical protein